MQIVLHVLPVIYHGGWMLCALWSPMRFCADHGQQVPIKEIEIQKYAKRKLRRCTREKCPPPRIVKSSMSIGAVVVDIGKHNTARDTLAGCRKRRDGVTHDA